MPYPFIGPTYQTQSRTVGSERLMNLYVEVTESPGEAKKATFYGTPGLLKVHSLANQPGRGLFAQDERCFAVAGADFVEVTSISEVGATVVVRGQLPNDGQPVSISSNGKEGHQLFITSAGQGYIFDLNDHSLTQIKLGDAFPPGVIMGGYIDGYFVAVWPNFFGISKRFDGTVWANLDHAILSFTSGHLHALAVHRRELWLIGEHTTEVWYHSGQGTPPFQPVPGAFIEMGTEAPWSITTMEHGIGWLGQNNRGGRYIVFAPQYVPQRISTHAVESALRGYPRVEDFRAYSYQENGHTFLMFTSPENNATWHYDMSVPAPFAWGERGWWNSTTGEYEAQRQIAHAYQDGLHIMLDRSHDAIYLQRLGLCRDDDVLIRSMRRLPHAAADMQLRYYSSFELGIESGVGSAEGSDPQLMLRCSNDGGFTWGNELWTSAGRQGQYGRRARWLRLGRARDRVFEVVQSDTAKRAWQWVDVQVVP